MPDTGYNFSDDDVKTLQPILEDLSVVYLNDLDHAAEMEVEMFVSDSKTSAAVSWNRVRIAANTFTNLTPLEKAQAVRLVVDSYNHEIEHILSSALAAKTEFCQQYPDFQEYAGRVFNWLEDRYVDSKRAEKWPGMRVSVAHKRDIVMSDSEPIPDAMDKSHQMNRGLFQLIYATKCIGYTDADDDVKHALARCYPLIEQYRNMDSKRVRTMLAHQVMDIVLEIVHATPAGTDTPDTGGSELGRAQPDFDVPSREESVGDGGGSDGGEDEDAEEDSTVAVDKSDDENGEGDETGNSGNDEEPKSDEKGEDGAGNGDANIGDGDRSEFADTKDTGMGQDSGQDVEATISKMEADDTGNITTQDIADEYGVDADNIGEVRDIDRERAAQLDTTVSAGMGDYDQFTLDDLDDVSDLEIADVKQRVENSNAVNKLQDELDRIESMPQPVPSESGPRLNRRNFVRNQAGNTAITEIYEDREIETSGNLLVVVAIDMSSSMRRPKSQLVDAKAALAAIAKATAMTGDTFAAVAFSTFFNERVQLVTGANQTFTYKQVCAVSAGGSTPTADGLKVALDITDNYPSRSAMVLCVNDGMPNVPSNNISAGANRPQEQVRAVVNHSERNGIPMVGVGVGSSISPEKMQSVFGNRSVVCEFSKLPKELVDVYLEYSEVDGGMYA